MTLRVVTMTRGRVPSALYTRSLHLRRLLDRVACSVGPQVVVLEFDGERGVSRVIPVGGQVRLADAELGVHGDGDVGLLRTVGHFGAEAGKCLTQLVGSLGGGGGDTSRLRCRAR